MVKNILKIVILGVALSLLTISCKKDKSNSSDTKFIHGVLETDLPEFAIVNQKIVANAKGITEDVENIKYKWKASGFNIADSLGQKISFVTPPKFGTYTISLTVSAEGYPSRNYSKEIIVLDPSIQKSLKGVKFPQSKITDPRDGSIYNFSTIGKLDWFSSNLNYKKVGVPYKEMDPLSYFYGRLYTWNEMSTDGGICPAGWRIPTNNDWVELAKNLNGGKEVSFEDRWNGLGEKLTVKAYLNDKEVWSFSPNNKPANTFLWNALPGGNAQYSQFSKMNDYGMWWSATEKDEKTAYFRYIYYDSPDFPYSYADKKNLAMSVRCVRDK